MIENLRNPKNIGRVSLEPGKSEKIRVISMDSYLSGISVGCQLIDSKQDIRSIYHLRLDENAPLFVLRRRFNFERNSDASTERSGSDLKQLETFFTTIANKGQLRNAEIYIGVTSDPLMPFDERFHSTMKCLELLSKFSIGKIYLQTRSPLVVLGLPNLEKLKKKLHIVFGLETNNEEIASTYTPNLPTVDERVKAIRTLRVFGFSVGVQVAPLLPYGEWREDAKKFATLLSGIADFVDIRPLVANDSAYKRSSYRAETNGIVGDLKAGLQRNRKFHWLRADSARHLKSELAEINPQLLELPKREYLEDGQGKLWSVGS